MYRFKQKWRGTWRPFCGNNPSFEGNNRSFEGNNASFGGNNVGPDTTPRRLPRTYLVASTLRVDERRRR